MEMSCWHVAFALMCIASFPITHAIGRGLNKDEITDILAYHNKYRAAVANGKVETQPKAQNIQEMTWDEALQNSAQTWADRMEFRHDTDLHDERFTHVGQNLHIRLSTSPTPERDFQGAVTGWFYEVHKPGFNGAITSGNGHYTQLIWANSYFLGCGYSFYKEGFFYNEFVVCNYGPGGNIIGHYPYIKGEPDCEKSGLKKSTRYPGLCISS